MFTGIITHLGKLTKKTRSVFTFNTEGQFCKRIGIGTSVAINGVCLTVFSKPTSNCFSVEIIPETLNKTMLGYIKPSDLVNLELPLTPKAFLSGHIVSGHVDGIGIIEEIKSYKNGKILTIRHPAKLSRFIVEKGSVAINGISLTIIQTKKDSFTVGVIPFTWQQTMLYQAKIKDKVNIEVDLLAKYLEKLLTKPQ